MRKFSVAYERSGTITWMSAVWFILTLVSFSLVMLVNFGWQPSETQIASAAFLALFLICTHKWQHECESSRLRAALSQAEKEMKGGA